MTKREQVLSALAALLSCVAHTQRNPAAVLPATVPDCGLLVMRDGDPGKPELVLSPLTYTYAHPVQIQVFVPPSAGDENKARDTLIAAVGAALANDPTLGGTAENTAASAPLVLHGPPGCDAPVTAVITITITYTPPSPLG